MKPLAVIPLLALLALTGCADAFKGATPYNDFALHPVTHQNLTPDETANLDDGTYSVEIGDNQLKLTTAVITGSGKKSKNGEPVQDKHVRIAIDTSAMPYDCNSDQYKSMLPDPSNLSQTPGDNGQADCIHSIRFITAPTQGTHYGENTERGTLPTTVYHGRSIIEFNTINDAYIIMSVTLGSGPTKYIVNLLTGDAELDNP